MGTLRVIIWVIESDTLDMFWVNDTCSPHQAVNIRTQSDSWRVLALLYTSRCAGHPTRALATVSALSRQQNDLWKRIAWIDQERPGLEHTRDTARDLERAWQGEHRRSDAALGARTLGAQSAPLERPCEDEPLLKAQRTRSPRPFQGRCRVSRPPSGPTTTTAVR